MMAGGKVKTTAVLCVSDRALSHPPAKVSLSSQPPAALQPVLKSVHFAYSNKLRRSFRVCAIPDRFSKKTESKLSFGTNRSYLDVVDLDVGFDSRPFHELQFDDHRSWTDWLTYIDQIESIEEQLKTMKSELDKYVVLERFSEAARIQSKLKLCQEHDLTHKVQKRLDEAIENEAFEEAAKIRDEGLIGLNGWWIAREKDDPCGKLIYIHQGFSHYVGRAFMASEVAMANDQRMPSLLSSNYTQGGEVVQFPGDLVLEVYLKEDENGSILHQPCVLRNPVHANLKETYKDEEGDSTEFEIQYEFDEEGNIRVVTMTRIANDELDNHENTNHEFFERVDEDVTSETTHSRVDEDVTSETTHSRVDGDVTSETTHSRVDGDATSETSRTQFRAASDIRWWDRNRFVLSIREDVQNANSEDDVSVEPESTVTSRTRIPKAFQASMNKILDDLKKEADDVLKKYGFGSTLFHEQSKHIIGNIELDSWEPASDSTSQLTGEVMFSRLPSDPGTLDPFSGFFVGEFGPHGQELLHLSRHRDKVSDREFVEARKITGDPSVPAGEVSFWAYIGRGARSSHVGRYPEELGIEAIYNGKGKIANEGFKNPRWVDGELLCFEKWSAMGQGSELGFVWSVPGRSRFLVYLTRVTLPKH